MMGIKRRAFLIGGAAIAGAGVFAVGWGDTRAASRAVALTTKPGEGSFATWVKIAPDDTVTLYSPHIDFGQGSNTALAQMLCEELDCDWTKIVVESAPADPAFANTPLGRGFLGWISGKEGLVNATPNAVFSLIARNLPLQITGGSASVRFTGQLGMRVAGAATRQALIAEAAERLAVPAGELTTLNGVVTHAKSGKSLRYGELAAAASERSLDDEVALKDPKDFRYIGKPVARLDVPSKVDGTALYGIDVAMPDLRVATIMAAPVRGGKLESVDPAPAMAVSGVEKVVKLDDAVAVIARGYWQAKKGLEALSPKFNDGGHSGISTPAIFAAHDAALKAGKADGDHGDGDVDAAFGAAGAKTVEAAYRLPYLHHATMEPFAMTAHFRDGKLDLWGGLQDPLATRMLAAKAADLDLENVTFHPTIMGGGFGRRFPDKCQIIGQVVTLAMAHPHPVKLIWSREEDVRHGTYRAQSSARLKAAIDAKGAITAWRNDYIQNEDAEAETRFIYALPAANRRFFEYKTNQDDGPWRSVNSTQQGFYNECFIDELASAAGVDPYQFRRRHLTPGSRHLTVLDEVAKRGGWGTPLPTGVGRGIAIVESFQSIVAQVIEASMGEDGRPKVHKVTAVVDCGRVVNPKNGDAQVMGGIVMGLSAAIGEAVTLEKGAVVQSNFTDYQLLKLAEAPPEINVHFLDSGAALGGLGEPGLPPTAPALANALFAATGTRIRQLPIVKA